MPHLRQDVATKEWVIFAPERARRPEDLRLESLVRNGWTHERPATDPQCPFCPDREVNTPGETLRYNNPDGTWQVRSCPNRYPALLPGEPPQRDGGRFERRMQGGGRHAVIIESPCHNTTLALQGREETSLVVRAWCQRYEDLRNRPESEHVILFKNHGVRGGTSLAHPHSQIVSLPVTPRSVRIRMEEAMRYHNDYGECVYCHLLWREKLDGRRIVVEGQTCSAFVPFAASAPFLVWIVPHQHRGCPSNMEPMEQDDFAAVMHETLARFYHGLGDPDYNLIFRTASRDYGSVPFAHWFAALIPRVTTPAGFEVGTGMFINTHLPEDDAAYLRDLVLPPLDSVVPTLDRAPADDSGVETGLALDWG